VTTLFFGDIYVNRDNGRCLHVRRSYSCSTDLCVRLHVLNGSFYVLIARYVLCGLNPVFVYALIADGLSANT